tara:strand:+ start:54 stop:1859 length:1806 start_codon:yes stop_codon:yes gene_type:complete
MLYISLLLTVFSLFFVKNLSNKYLKFVFLFFNFINLLFFSVYYFFDFLSGDGLNEAVIFHIIFGINGFGLKEYILPGTLLFSFIFISFLTILYRNKKIHIDRRKNFRTQYISFIFVFLAILINPLLSNFLNIFKTSIENNKYENNYFFDQPITLISEPKNIIFLYLEQFELTYTDESIFPDLTPNLKELKKRAVSFTNISSPKATNWTISGMAASQCGVPLLTPIASENSMSGMDKFLPSAVCIGDILYDNNYKLHYTGGSDLDFAGKGNFYRSHGFNQVDGWYQFKDNLLDESYRSPWGLFDDSLYEININRLNELVENKESFGLFTLTLDTHHPNGYLSKSCNGIKYRDGKNSILNSIHCADQLAGSFIKNIINSKIFDDTILVVVSDHLALKNTATSELAKGDRKNLFLIFSNNIAAQEISKPASVFDISPTVLSLMGFNAEGLGLGRNLFFKKSLNEEDISIDEIISINRTKILSLWSFPQINKGFKLSTLDKRVYFNDRYINFPALILLDKENIVEEIRFDFYYANPLARKVNEVEDLQDYIWIDECKKINKFKNKIDNNESNFCVLLGTKGSKNFTILNNSENIDKDIILTFFNN